MVCQDGRFPGMMAPETTGGVGYSLTEYIVALDGLLESLRDSYSARHCNIEAASLKREKHNNSNLNKLFYLFLLVWCHKVPPNVKQLLKQLTPRWYNPSLFLCLFLVPTLCS